MSGQEGILKIFFVFFSFLKEASKLREAEWLTLGSRASHNLIYDTISKYTGIHMMKGRDYHRLEGLFTKLSTWNKVGYKKQ